MKKVQEEIKITFIGNEKENYVMGLDVNGEYYNREEGEELKSFLARVTKENYGKTRVNILPYFTKKGLEKTYSQKHSTYFKEKIEEEKKKCKTPKSVKKAAAILVAAIMGTTVIATNLTGCKDTEAKTKAKTKAKTEQAMDSNKLKNKSLEELISMLDEKSGQKEAIQTILDTKNYFNVQAAPSIVTEQDAQENAQLYITGDEELALYMYANILAIGPTEMNNIFGQSKFVWINKENDDQEPIYERGTPGYIKELIDNTRPIYANYYSRATEPSGLSNLFTDEEEREFFEAFENLVLDYNRTGDENTKKEIQAVLKAIFASNDIDTLGEQFPGASLIIAKVIAPELLVNGVVCKDGYNKISIGAKDIEDRIEASLDLWYDIQKNKTIKNSNVVSRLIQISNLDVIGLNRNIANPIEMPKDCFDPCIIEKCNAERNCETFTEKEKDCIKKFKKTYKTPKKVKKEGCKYTVKKPVIPEAKDSFISNKTTKKVTVKTHQEIDESKAEKYKDIEKITKDAKDKCEEKIAEDNAKEEERAKTLIEDNQKTENEKVQNKIDEYNKTHPETYTKPVENTSAPTQSAPPEIEVINETYYDNDGNVLEPTSFVKKIKSIIVNGKEYKVLELVTANNKVRVRS